MPADLAASDLTGGDLTGIGPTDRLAALSDTEFAASMARFEPFEPTPDLAVAVSGGADSLALVLLAEHWARARGGRVLGLTVDHGLRAEAPAEAARVAAWLAARGIAHRTLRWQGPPPSGDVQAAARRARYALLAATCGEQGILHLLTAHHREDQAETLLLRLARGSGIAGLAGMAALVEGGACRILRPLLAVPRDRLRAALDARGQDWIEDSSNRNPAYARVRLRQAAAVLEAAGLEPGRLATTARQLGRARAALEAGTDRLLARAATLHPAGFIRLDPAPLRRAPTELALRALAASLATIGGSDYPPRFERLERLWDRIQSGDIDRPRTLGGCRLIPTGAGLIIHREFAAMAGPLALGPTALSWDGRFVAGPRDLGTDLTGLQIAGLGSEGVRRVGSASDKTLAHFVPRRVWPVLPAIWSDRDLIAVPHLAWALSGRPHSDPRWSGIAFSVRFRPKRALTSSGFTVV
jgi:tRNA(Ile)-lysidine synthase